MRRASLIAAAGIVVLANVFALAHAARNRGGIESEITLTQREAPMSFRSADDDDSGVSLSLRWTDPTSGPWPGGFVHWPTWLDQARLAALGFDCSVEPDSPDASRHYQRQRTRQAFVALEYDGPAWQKLHALAEQAPNQGIDTAQWSHLVPIDADHDAGALRARHPDRSSVIVLPAIIGLRLNWLKAPGEQKERPRIVGYILELPDAIHVPRPFSDEFRRRAGEYRVRLRYGAMLEPWVVAVAR